MKEIYANADAGLIGLLICLAIFMGVLVWVFRPSNKKTFKEHGNIPLKDD